MTRRARHELHALLTNVPLIIGSLGILAIVVMALFGPDLAPHSASGAGRIPSASPGT